VSTAIFVLLIVVLNVWYNHFRDSIGENEVSIITSVAINVLLTENDVSQQDAIILLRYVDAISDVLVSEPERDFRKARELVVSQLPEHLRFIGNRIVDLIQVYTDRYMQNGDNTEKIEFAKIVTRFIKDGIESYVTN
jgi:hypothetical protein